MAITLEMTHSPSLLRYAGGDRFTLTEGQRLQVRHNGSGEVVDILDETTDIGEEWEYNISIVLVKRIA